MESALSPSQALLVLNALPHVGPITANRLLEACGGDPAAVLAAAPETLRAVRGVGPVIAATLATWRAHVDLAAEERGLQDCGAAFVAAADDGYPPLLREIHDPPIGLYCRGRYEPGRTCVAIVGSRRTTQYGLATARRLGGELARRGFCVVSGLARGIDTAAHEGALEAGGGTAAVLGTGVDLVYPPENRALTERIAREGALLSEFRLGRPADRQSFAMRNRIVAGMSAAIVVVESDVDGGSMITARFAAEQGRVVLAVPGRIDQPTSAGCHQLIRDGAVLLTSVEDVVDELGYLRGLRPGPIPDNAARGVVRGEPADGDGRPHREGEDETAADRPPGSSLIPPPASPAEAAVLELFRGGAILATEDVALGLGWSAERAMAVILRLELGGRLVKRADGRHEEAAGR
ncbi:MAG: DNA-protecting protein DprA [Verrucomicrobia bacterium]|nr:DNA-protecting protein DprA [Verrucomicrobiota bacterium]